MWAASGVKYDCSIFSDQLQVTPNDEEKNNGEESEAQQVKLILQTRPHGTMQGTSKNKIRAMPDREKELEKRVRR